MVWRPSNLPNPRVFFDVAVGGRDAGRITFELFADQLPITTENFRCLATGETGLGYWLRPRWYKTSTFHRIIPGFMAHGGDFNEGSGYGGESIYGRFFREEKFLYKHSKRGLLSMSRGRAPHTLNSCFFITFGPAPWLDGKHVVFGQVESGWEALDAIEKVGTEGGKPRKQVQIFNCGELLPDTFRSLTEEEQHREKVRYQEIYRLKCGDQEAGKEHEPVALPMLSLPDTVKPHSSPEERPLIHMAPKDEEPIPLTVYRRDHKAF